MYGNFAKLSIFGNYESNKNPLTTISPICSNLDWFHKVVIEMQISTISIRTQKAWEERGNIRPFR